MQALKEDKSVVLSEIFPWCQLLPVKVCTAIPFKAQKLILLTEADSVFLWSVPRHGFSLSTGTGSSSLPPDLQPLPTHSFNKVTGTRIPLPQN